MEQLTIIPQVAFSSALVLGRPVGVFLPAPQCFTLLRELQPASLDQLNKCFADENLMFCTVCFYKVLHKMTNRSERAILTNLNKAFIKNTTALYEDVLQQAHLFSFTFIINLKRLRIFLQSGGSNSN